MNINEYIEKYSTIETKDTEITVTLCVPAKESVTLANNESVTTQHMRIFTQDIETYLKHKGLSINKVLQTCSVDNAHPRGLTGTWIFSTDKVPARKRRTTKPKQTKK
jgi:ribosomal protein S8